MIEMNRRQFIKFTAATAATEVALNVLGRVAPAKVEAANRPLNEQQSAEMYGASAYTRKASSWNNIPYNHGLTTDAHLKRDGGTHHRINTGGAGSVEAWLRVHGDDSVDFFRNTAPGTLAISLAIDPAAVPQVDTEGASVWTGPDVSPMRTLHQLTDREGIEQPGTIVIPVGFEPECPALVRPPERPTTAEAAARLYGMDGKYEYASNPDNWSVTPHDNGRVLEVKMKADESGQHHRVGSLIGTVYEGYWDIADDGEVPFAAQKGTGKRAVSYAADGTAVPTIDTRSIKVWIINNDQGYPEDRTVSVNQLWDGVVKREAKEQPGILVLPLGFKPGSNACPVDP